MGTVFRVESQGRCLFCHEKEGGEDLDGEEGKEETFLEQFSLRQICHYLRVNLKQEILIFRKGEKRTSPKDFSVTLCRKCCGVAGRLTSLCRELELIQMWIEYSFKELVQLTSISPPSLESEEVKDFKSQIAKLLRDRIRKLSISTLKKSRQPQVQLEKLESEENERSDDFEDTQLPSPPESSLQSTESPRLEGFQETQEFGNNMKTSTPSSDISNSKQSNAHPCPFCSESLLDARRFKFHMVITHPEHLFSAAKLPEVSEAKFRALSLVLIREETKTRLPHNRFYKCSHCYVAHKERRCTAGHLVDYHYDILVKKLKNMQILALENVETVDNDADEDINNADGPPFSVSVEDTRASSSSVANRDNSDKVSDFIVGMEQQLPKTSLKRGNENVFKCVFCPNSRKVSVFAGNIGLLRHTYRFHPEYFFMAYRKPFVYRDKFKAICAELLKSGQVESYTNGGNCVMRCFFCSHEFNEVRNLPQHLIRVHYSNLCRKLDDIQRTSEVGRSQPEVEVREIVGDSRSTCPECTCKYCGAAFHNRRALSVHCARRHKYKFDIDKSKSNNRARCHSCGMHFSCRANLTRHLRKQSCKQGSNINIGLASSAATVQHTNDEENSVPKQGIHSLVKCKYCALAFLNIFGLARHMKLRHPQYQSQNKNPKATCHHCQKEFSCSSNLRRHLKFSCTQLTKSASTYDCEYCGATMTSSVHFKQHLLHCANKGLHNRRLENDEEFVELEETSNTITFHSNVESSDDVTLNVNCHTKMEQMENELESAEDLTSSTTLLPVITSIGTQEEEEEAFDVNETLDVFNTFNDENEEEQECGVEMIMPDYDPLQM